MKRGYVSKGRIFGDSGKNLSGVILLDCYYWSELLGKWFGLGQKRADRSWSYEKGYISLRYHNKSNYEKN